MYISTTVSSCLCRCFCLCDPTTSTCLCRLIISIPCQGLLLFVRSHAPLWLDLYYWHSSSSFGQVFASVKFFFFGAYIHVYLLFSSFIVLSGCRQNLIKIAILFSHLFSCVENMCYSCLLVDILSSFTFHCVENTCYWCLFLSFMYFFNNALNFFRSSPFPTWGIYLYIGSSDQIRPIIKWPQ